MCLTSGLKKSAVVEPWPGMGRYIWQEIDLAVIGPEPGIVEVADLGQEERGPEPADVVDEVREHPRERLPGPLEGDRVRWVSGDSTGRLWLRLSAATISLRVASRSGASRACQSAEPFKAWTRRIPCSPPSRRSDMHWAVSRPWKS